MAEVSPDYFLRLMIHNRQALSDAANLRHFKPPATHWNELAVAMNQKHMLHPWIYYAAQRSLLSTLAIIPSMDLRSTSIHHAQKIVYNLIITNLDFMLLKKHNKEKDQSLLGAHFKSQLAMCTETESVNDLADQGQFLKIFY